MNELYIQYLNKDNVWCYMGGKTSVEIAPRIAHFPPTSHNCPNWPPNLLPFLELTLLHNYRHFCAVVWYLDGAKREGFLFAPSSCIPYLLPGTKLHIFGVWIYEDLYLLPGSQTSWRVDSSSQVNSLHSPLQLFDASMLSHVGFGPRLLRVFVVMFFGILSILHFGLLEKSYHFIRL